MKLTMAFTNKVPEWMVYSRLVHMPRHVARYDQQAQCSLHLANVKENSETCGVQRWRGSVVVMLHLCPVSDPILFLRLLELKAQVELVALSLAYPHPLMLWHDSIIDGPLEESKLLEQGLGLMKREYIWDKTLNSCGLQARGCEGKVKLR